MIAADKELVSLFIDEAKLVIQLNNPNICKVFDWGKVEDSYYLAMEYISGCTLRQAFQRCKEQEIDGAATMPLAQACLIAMKLCEGAWTTPTTRRTPSATTWAWCTAMSRRRT